MITAMKKNKILTILTALVISLIAIIFPFSIKNNSKNMSVMAESSTAPVVTAEWFDFSKPYFENNIDFFASSLKNISNVVFSAGVEFYLYDYNGVDISSTGFYSIYYYNNDNNFTSLTSTSEYEWSIIVTDGGNSYIDLSLNSSNVNYPFVYCPNFIVVLFNSNSNNYQCLCSPALTYAYNSYKEAISSDY